MKLSYSTLGCPRWGWNDIIATARDLKYDGIEVRGVGKDISVPSVPQFGTSEIDRTRAQLADLNLTIPCLASDCCINIKERKEETMRDVIAYMELASKLNTPFVRIMASVAVPQPTGNVDVEFVKDVAIELATYAKKYDVTLLIETNGIWANSEKLAKLISDVNSPYVGSLWDIHHPYRYFGEKPATTWENLKSSLRHVHMKDARLEDGKSRYAMVGYGDLPVEDSISILQSGGYDGFYSLEWLKRWDVTLEEPGIVFAHYVNYMRSFT